MLRRVGRIVGYTAAAGTAAAVGGGAYMYATDPGTRRSFKFWSGVMPVYFEYRWMQWKMRGEAAAVADPQWEALHEKHAPHIEALTLELKGFYLKNAQLMSTQDAFVPKPYLQMCKRMQNEVPSPLQPGEARQIVVEALVEDPFEEFDPEPIAAASIGQVHRAKLRSSGEVVAVKVQYPGIEDKFRADIDTTIRFCQLALPSQVPALKEIRKQFLTEFNYNEEGKQQERVREQTMPKWGKHVKIARVHLDLCRRNVLTQEWIEGPTLIKGIRKQYQEYAKQMGTTLEELETKQKEGIKNGTIQLRSVQAERQRHRLIYTYTRAKDFIMNTLRAVYNHSISVVFRTPKKQLVWSQPPVDLASMLLLLHEVHADQLFLQEAGFNGDPHPGNILLCDDGRLGLVDYGQVKKLDPHAKAKYARLVLALAEDDTVGMPWHVAPDAHKTATVTAAAAGAVAAAAAAISSAVSTSSASAVLPARARVIESQRAIGYRTKHSNPEILYRVCCFWNDREDPHVTGGLNISEFIDAMEAADPVCPDGFPDDFVMPARLSVLLRGMANAFGIRMRSAPLWAPAARKYLEQYEKQFVVTK
jgi:aarF domain-containing kinase